MLIHNSYLYNPNLKRQEKLVEPNDILRIFILSHIIQEPIWNS